MSDFADKPKKGNPYRLADLTGPKEMKLKIGRGRYSKTRIKNCNHVGKKATNS